MLKKKKHYFRFRWFISLFLGAFNVFYVKFGSCYSSILIRSYFRIYFLVGKHFFNIIDINKNSNFV